jgi:hypothetical protein
MQTYLLNRAVLSGALLVLTFSVAAIGGSPAAGRTSSGQITDVTASKRKAEGNRFVLALSSNPVYQDPSGNQSVVQPPTTGLTVNALNGVITVDNNKYPRTAQGIQNAINDAQSGGSVFLPTGIYTLNPADLPIKVSKPVSIIGAGWGTVLQAPATISATSCQTCKDVFDIQPPSDGLVMRDFLIARSDVVRDGIHFDGRTGPISRLVIDHVYIDQSLLPPPLGARRGAAIYGEGAGWANGMNQGSPVLTTIQNSLLKGGITIDICGDTVRVLNNAITGEGVVVGGKLVLQKAIDVSFVSGASTFILSGNSITSDGGIHLGTNAIAAQILSNEIETPKRLKSTFPMGAMGSHDAIIDIDGNASDIMVQNNSIQVVNDSQADGIRVNAAERTLIVGNRFGRGPCTGCTREAVGVRMGPNAKDTLIGANTWPGTFSSRVLCVVGGVIDPDWKKPISCGSTSTVLATASANDFVLQAGTEFFLAAEAACLASGALDRFLKWSAGVAETCTDACKAVTCGSNPAATCVEGKGWTMWTGSVHYQYGSECKEKDPSGNQGISGKLCCCVGTGCAQPLFK